MPDGVHEVDQVYELLSEELDETIHRFAGFDRGEVDEKLDTFDVLVSNSAVEVGLDFKPSVEVTPIDIAVRVVSTAASSTIVQCSRAGLGSALRDETERHRRSREGCASPGGFPSSGDLAIGGDA